MASDPEREQALEAYKKTLLDSREWEAKLKALRLDIKGLQHDFDVSEDNIKALQSVGQIIGEVLKQLDEERFIVKASSGPRYVVGCRSKVDKAKLKQGTRVALDMTTLTIMRMLPREVDPMVYNMSLEDPGQVSFGGIGGLNDQIRELREVIELPLKNPELFLRVGIKPPKGVLLYGPPGTGKTLLARAVASGLETNFLKVVSSAIVDKYIGESARLIREMFGYAKEHEPCIIFMDEIDAIGGRRFSEEHPPIAKFNEHSWNSSTSSTVSTTSARPRSSWQPTDLTRSIPPCSEPVVWTGRSKFRCLTRQADWRC